MSQSVPIEIYFNPDFRNKYAKKVIDSFFTTFNQGSRIINPENDRKINASTKVSLRGRMKEWKMRNKLDLDIQLMDTGKFIRSSPKKSMFSDF